MDLVATNRGVIEQFRAGGPIEGMSRERLLLLTTTGRRTGQPRTSPMMFVEDGDRLLVIASCLGAPEHPQWYRNLVADPAVTVEIGDERYAATAIPLPSDERAPMWADLVERYPFFADHQARTSREIPVVALTRTA